MPDEDKTFSNSLFLDLRIWRRHVHTLSVHSPKRMERAYAWHVTKAKMCVTGEKQLKHIRDSWIYEKVWLKTDKSIGETWIVLKFPYLNYLPSKVTLP